MAQTKRRHRRHNRSKTETREITQEASGSTPEPGFPASDLAADLENYLKSRINSLTYRGLIRDIRVEESNNGRSLEVTIVPEGEVVSFGTIHADIGSVDSDAKWKRKKKGVYGNVKGYHPRLDPDYFQQILKEADAVLMAWRRDHLFSEEMREALSSRAAAGFFSAGRMAALSFLAGRDRLSHLRTDITGETARVEFQQIPCKAECDLLTGEIRFSLSGADSLYARLAHVMEDVRVREDIQTYLREKGVPASVISAGKKGTFQIFFEFPLGTETETVTVEKTYRRIVLAAFRQARERAQQKQKEAEKLLKTCPYYGTFIAQAAVSCIDENGGYLTRAQLVNLLRGVNISDDYVLGDYAGRYNLMPKAEISHVLDVLIQFDIIREHLVRGQYQNYYVCRVTAAGRLFVRLQSDPAPKKNPATEQEYHLLLRAVRDDVQRLSVRERNRLLGAIAGMPGIFLTDPVLVLDCLERMGEPAAGFISSYYREKGNRENRRILKLLMNAASGKGKELPKNGADAFRERKERKRREKEEAERRDRQLFEMVLTEIPDNYVDLYPAARLMHRKFVLHIGPTNSGKTHDAIEELMRADTGIYLAPLRLLAYEQYEKLNRAECPCSLVTGEEQYLIDGARHQASTIEMLSFKTLYDVAVIDEAQMIADRARGGAWTAAIMGVCAETVHICAAPEAEQRLIGIIEDCGDEYTVVRHKRMTPLEYEEKPFKFPEDVREGDALIVFSRRNVHAVAAQLRKNRIQPSIIYGALPYDVRHKQAELFATGQNRVVVATDAIGMGMNLPIRRVVLMETTKYDGFSRRPLTQGEIAQIVGRAGRYGIYDVGYAAAADLGVSDDRSDFSGGRGFSGGQGFSGGRGFPDGPGGKPFDVSRKIRRAIKSAPRPIEEAVIDFPETLLTVDAPLLDLIRKWEQVVPAEGWQKESIEQNLRLAELTQDLNAPKRLAYDFLTVPFEDDDQDLLNIWLDIFEKEVRGEEYSIYDRVDAMILKNPDAADAIDGLEHQHRVLDLYFSLARKFQPVEDTLAFIMEKKRDCSARIMKVLERQGFKEKRCKSCGRMLPWNYPYGICSRCWGRH